MKCKKRILALVLAMTIGLSGASSMSAVDMSLQVAGSPYASQVQAAESVELPVKLASAAYSGASEGVRLKANSDPLKINDQMTSETYSGEWLDFQVSVPSDGEYLFSARVQSPAGERPRMDVLVDMEQTLTVEEGDPAGEGVPWLTTAPQSLTLKKGEHTVRIAFNSDFELSWINFASAVEPIEIGDGTQIPVMEYARISKDNVETETGDDPAVPGGRIPKYMMAGDWIEYNLTVPEEAAGAYHLAMNVARAGTDAGQIGMQCYLDGVLAGQTTRAGTGGWKNWMLTDALELDLSAGEHVLKIVYTTQFNMSMLQFTQAVKGDKHFKIDAVNYTRASKKLNTEAADDPEVESGLIPAGTYAGDWLEYTFDVSEDMAGTYNLLMHVARAGTDAGAVKLKAELDGAPVMDFVRGGTGGWKSWVETDPAVVKLTAGTHTLKVSFVNQFNLSLIKFEQEKEISDVIKVDASNFSRGSKNFGMETCKDPEVSSGKNPTSTMAGDWLEYNIQVPKKIEGDFKLSVHAARATTEPDLIGMECYVDGELAAIVTHDGTGGWQNWQATAPVGVNLEAGNHTVRIALTKQFNLSLIKLEKLEVAPGAKVTDIAVRTQEPCQAIKGKTTSFFAAVEGDEGCDPFVTWEVEGATSAKISDYGLLSVSFGDPADTVTVRARSRSNPEVVSDPVEVPLIDESTEHGRLSREIAEEGMVLLKNDNEALPLTSETNVALLGIGQASYVKGGSGSGDVESAYVRTIQEGLLDKAANRKIKLYEPLSDYYSSYYARVGGGYGTDEPEMTGELAQLVDEAAAQENATAVVVLRRRTGEGSDIGIKAGEYYLRSREKELIQTALNQFDRVVVVLNIGVVMDLNWLNTVQSDEGRSVDAVFLAWQPGMEGGIAVANALCGEVNPSGKLTDTFVTSFDDYPSAKVYENSGRNAWVSYEEDIFVGYRYFETFEPDKVIFPFGYGLSYTSFSIDQVNAAPNLEKGTMEIAATVTNTGKTAGKEVVQTYFSAPAGDLPKPALELAAFQKTELLQPGESQTVTMSFDLADMASYDDVGKTGEESAFVLEPGDYQILVGNSVRDTVPAGVYSAAELTVTEQLAKVFQPANADKKLERRLDGTGPDSYETTVWSDSEIPAAKEAEPAQAPAPRAAAEAVRTAGETILLADVADNPALMTAFLEQLSDDQLIILSRGTGSDNPREIVDGANTACTKEILEFGIPRLQTADGPAGIRNNKYTATAWPCATMQACTWNPGLVEAAGKAGAEEAKTFKTLDKYKNLSMGNDGFPIWLTPSTNIHRNPMCGRNFEYYSEDPYIAGKMAAAQIRGIQSEGVSATLKHFSANNSENYRKNSDSMVSERAMREIYLRPFEIAVKESQPWCVMSSYNLINGTRAAEDSDLLTQVLRNEWNFKGTVMTDWGSESTLVEEIKAGNDLKMPSSGSNDDPAGAPGSLQLQAVRDALADGSLSRKTLERNIRNTMRMILHTYFFDGDKAALEVYNPVDIQQDAAGLASTDFRFYYENEPVFLHVPVDAKNVAVLDGNSQSVAVEKLADGEYTFVMPDSAVKVYINKEAAKPQMLSLQWNPNQAEVEIAGEAEEIFDGNGIYAANVVPGTKLTFTFTPVNGPFASAKLNGEDIPFEADGFTYTYTMPEEKASLRFTFTVVDKSILETLLETANEITDEQLDKLVPSMREKFIAARGNAQNVFDDAFATQDDVNNAWEKLLDAMHYLSFEEGTKDELEYWLDYASKLDLDSFTPKSLEGYAEALAYAEEIYNDEGETLKAEVEKASKDLYDAIMRLKFRANMETLQLFVNQAHEIDLDKYVDGPEKEAFDAILPQAEALLEDADATQKQVDGMAENLYNAMMALRLTPDREALKDLLDESEALDPADYTEASYAILRAAMNLAWDAYNDDAATPKTIAVNYAGVQQARTGLVLADNEPEEPIKPDNKPNKGGSSGSKKPVGNTSGTGTAVAVTNPVVNAAQNVMGQKSVRSDTTANFTLKRGNAYCFKMTVVNGSNAAPSFTVGDGNVLKTQFVAKIGNDYYYRVWATGTPGQSTGVYTTMVNEAPQQHCVVTVG